ncbi:protein-L-isoaspartate(D-aspartate) O-methyltransferase [Alteriqipengyuania flavescens]|uniref:protein-L-isoaspartate(D-aspartate) O-methyltransferase n=1 Tax=Alteriqipengyuania flavescens TaxID=3053610 RepID=UPI0025B45893|nr:protein-L-isoaspartate(D-aspartate) O-methyltransferase [Alteriqipengyuania flavescens]WJY19898.1 protein-L-isoaspartate(D-aspartate) O-methyltransferase [Alteriqipengyuania flavescens]WJY25842.1 protein-L-isoaspartate(D-aspartate) O-methyltransferase [Alteriqipengyuania flavescens]
MTESRQAERERMVERQIAARGIKDEAILSAFREVPRESFVDPEMEAYAYEDSALPIPSGQTISQPYIVACMIAAAQVKAEDTVLEVGAGSGYAAAVLSRIASEVHAIERHEVLARQAMKRMTKLGYDNCHVIAGDGLKGLPDQAPFDAILVAARTDEVPNALKSQLKIGGRLVIPVGEEKIQQLQAIVRTGEDSWTDRDITPVRFVPLLDGVVAEGLAQKT